MEQISLKHTLIIGIEAVFIVFLIFLVVISQIEVGYKCPVGEEWGKFYWAHSDDLLEDWGTATAYSGTFVKPELKKRGSIIQLENAIVAKLKNSNAGPGICAWVMQTYYNTLIRDYGFDTMFSNPSKQPSSTPSVSQVVFWSIK